MLENISNNSMYTTIPPEVEICFTEEELWDRQNEILDEPCDFYVLDMDFLERDIAEFEDILENAPEEMV